MTNQGVTEVFISCLDAIIAAEKEAEIKEEEKKTNGDGGKKKKKKEKKEKKRKMGCFPF